MISSRTIFTEFSHRSSSLICLHFVHIYSNIYSGFIQCIVYPYSLGQIPCASLPRKNIHRTHGLFYGFQVTLNPHPSRIIMSVRISKKKNIHSALCGYFYKNKRSTKRKKCIYPGALQHRHAYFPPNLLSGNHECGSG